MEHSHLGAMSRLRHCMYKVMQHTQKCIIHHLSSVHILILETIFLGHIPLCKCHCVGTSYVYSIRTVGVIKLELCCSRIRKQPPWWGRVFRLKHRTVHVTLCPRAIYLDRVTIPCCRAPRATAWCGGNSASPPTMLCRGPSGRGCNCPGWCAADGEGMKMKTPAFFSTVPESHVKRRAEGEGTLTDSWITKVHKKSLTKINHPCCRILVIKASLRNLSRTPALKIFCFSPISLMLCRKSWRLGLN